MVFPELKTVMSICCPSSHDPQVSVLTNSLAMALKKVRTLQNSKNGFDKGSKSENSGF